MNIGFIIYNNGIYGGAEKRIPRIINWLADNSEYSIHVYLSNRLNLWINSLGISFSDLVSITLYDDMKNIHKSSYNEADIQLDMDNIKPNTKHKICKIIPSKVKYLKEGVKTGKHYFSSVNKNPIFDTNLLNTWSIEDAKKVLNEEVKKVK